MSTEELVDGNYRPDRELDPSVRKLLEADSASAGDYEVILVENSYYNHNEQYHFDDPKVVEHVVTNLRSVSIKEILPTTSYYGRNENGLGIKVYEQGAGGKYCAVVILGKNKEGNYILSLADDNTIMAEVVEGDLDYQYLKQLYQSGTEERQ